ncbi:hypothetical protein SUTMEG_06750 [Sutterella megalosphaeroides]|uniref:Uncharacterized protein n=1 Tax=Sutterella megalosphaeroides TaxID=2494234 RepID=A0A2Z6I8W2_9BURK|nr:hypothetical protein SUTMEG_06750 [Sutterella megalosphaeroides]
MKFPIGGKVRERRAVHKNGTARRSGATPEPTVTVRKEEQGAARSSASRDEVPDGVRRFVLGIRRARCRAVRHPESAGPYGLARHSFAAVGPQPSGDEPINATQQERSAQ